MSELWQRKGEENAQGGHGSDAGGQGRFCERRGTSALSYV